MESSATLQIDFTDQLSEVVAAIQGGSSFLVVSHLRPDGDAVGCVGALSKSLRKAGKFATIALADPVPERFNFILEDEMIIRSGNLELTQDVVLVLDSGDLARTGFESELENSNALLVNIDHHASNTVFGDINFLDSKASSTCEMVLALIEKAKLPLDPEIGEALYLGLVTDTRFFQNEQLRASAHRAAETLLSAGVNTTRILNTLNAGRSLAELKVLGLCLSKLQLACDGRLAYFVFSWKDFLSCGASMENIFSSGVFGHMVSVKGVVVGVGVFEDSTGKSYCEFRSKGGFDVKEIAVEMGGGGHLAASGCSRSFPVEDLASEAVGKLTAKLANFQGNSTTKCG